MSKTSSLTQWLDHLIDLSPPNVIRLVGAGNGRGIWAQWLAAHDQVPATLVEANSQLFAALQRQQAIGNWGQASLLNTVIAPTAGEVDFFTASLTAESGILPAEELRAVWPNVYTVATERRAATDLTALLQVDAEPSAAQQWLLLDCLPAAPLLRSAQAQLQHVDVVMVRVLQAVDSSITPLTGMGACLEDVTKALPGFRLLALQPSRHPALAHALFVRDHRSAAQQALQIDLTQITEVCDAEAKARQAALQAQADLQALLTKLQTENAELLQQLELQAQAQQALQTDLTQITEVCDAEAKARQAALQAQVELHAQLEKLQAENAKRRQQQELQAQVQQALQADLAKISEARDADIKARQADQHTLAELRAQVEELLAENAELLQQLELQAQAQQALQADLDQIVEARDAEAKASQTAQQAQADLQAQLFKVQAENAEALKKPDQQTLLAESFKQQKIEIDVQLKKQSDELIRVRKLLDASLKKEISNATRQIEASLCLQNYFETDQLPYINTEGHTWPISPDFALYLIELLEFNDYDLIIEFGSGISTSIIGKTLEKIAPRRVGRPAVDFVSFDHLEKYYQKTHAQLAHAGLAHIVQLILAPLKEWLAPNGITYSYYDCQSVLAELAKKHSAVGLRMLVIVDGPPAATGKHARYPAEPLILEHFSGAHIEILLDDYMREDEKEIAKLWQDDITAAQLAYTVNERKLEKDACLITVGNTKENP